MNFIIIIAVLAVLLLLLRIYWKNDNWKNPTKPFPTDWRTILVQHVVFYNALTIEEKKLFEYEIQEFLLNCRITGIDTTIDITDKLLVAASAVIPIFKFPEWKYTNLYEVLIYSSAFNEKFETTGEDRRILGMVGTGYMEGKMILSKPALHYGFKNSADKKNTAIHEFIHLIDKKDGKVDGIPEVLLQQQYVIPWMDLIKKEIDAIYESDSDINPYGGENEAEFFSVASEYFFERPKMLKSKHPELYIIMEDIFKHNMTTRNFNRKKHEIGRNSPCPCGSGLKFKYCCGKK